MSLIRAVNSYNTIIAGTIPDLNTHLTDPVSLADFTSEILTSERRTEVLAGSALGMEKVLGSEIARNSIFTYATTGNQVAAKNIANSITGLPATASSVEGINAAFSNEVSKVAVTSSQYYGDSIALILANLSGLDVAVYPTTASIINDAAPFGDVVGSTHGMSALLADAGSVGLLVTGTVPMQLVVADTNSITALANSKYMPEVAAASESITVITASSLATGIVSSVPDAVKSIANFGPAWDVFRAGANFSANVKQILVNIIGLNVSNFASINDVVDSADAIALISSNLQATQALLSDSGAVTHLKASANLGAMLNSSVSMGVIASDEAFMGDLISNAAAFPLLLNSTLAKSTIFGNASLFATMMSDAGAFATLDGMKQSFAGPTNNKVFANFQPFGLSGNVIILSGSLGSIVATTLANKFKGDTQAEVTVNVPGVSVASSYPAINAPFTNPQWTINSISALAAAKITVTYVDFN